MNIAIWGMGISGLSALRFLSNENHNLYAINSGNPCEWGQIEQIDKFVSRDQCFDQSRIPNELTLDLIILSPGIDPRIPELARFRDVKKYCEVELAYKSLKKNIPIVAVTGTNGKTTTVTLMTKALEKTGQRVFLGGNIGTPFCDFFLNEEKFDYIVLELSSFQLELLEEFRANFACILNITPSHMERYDNFHDYEVAKMKIQDNQLAEDKLVAPNTYFSKKSQSQKVPMKNLEGFDWDKSLLKGDHYKENFFPVYQMLHHFGFMESDEIIQELINEFPGVQYRLQFRANKRSLKFYNDSKSTNKQSTLTALKSFDKEKIILVMGGKRRGVLQNLDEIKAFKNIAKIYAFGDAAGEIRDQLKNSFLVVKLNTLSEVFEDLRNESNSSVIISPAYPSFDQFQSYIKRGEYIDELVEKF